MLLMHSFAVYHKTDVIISKVHSSNDVGLFPGSSISKMFAGNMLFRAIIGTDKKNFLKQLLQSFKEKNVLCNNSNQACFSDKLTSAGPLGGC